MRVPVLSGTGRGKRFSGAVDNVIIVVMESEIVEWILASRQGKIYVPDEVIVSFDDIKWDFEYSDIAGRQFQVWKFPDGEVFDIEPDRTLPLDANQFATPYSKGKILWRPILRLVGNDTELVANGHAKLHGTERF